MPYKTLKVRGKNCYKVINNKSKKVFSKCTTKKNAIAQLRLLRAIEYNKNFVLLKPNQRSKRSTMKKRS